MNGQRLVEQALALGAYRASVIGMDQVVFDPGFRTLCASNACGNYGKCWMCPPDAGPIEALIAQTKGYRRALVYQTVGQLEDSYDFEGMMEAAQRHNRIAQALRRSCPEEALHLGAGGCHVCPVCAKRTDQPCRHPEQAMASLETYGIDVSALARAGNMQYINGPNTVTYFGAVLF